MENSESKKIMRLRYVASRPGHAKVIVVTCKITSEIGLLTEIWSEILSGSEIISAAVKKYKISFNEVKLTSETSINAELIAEWNNYWSPRQPEPLKSN